MVRRGESVTGRDTSSALDDAYDECRRILARHSSSYSWATRLLPADRRPHVQALYAFARTADDLVDRPRRDPAAALAAFRERFDAAVAGRASPVERDDWTAVLLAVANTIEAFAIRHDAFERFFDSMTMDLTVCRYDTWADLLAYMEGSAAAIGEMMLPILDPVDAAAALGPARDLGLAFQLTNFLRDVGDDLARGREYLPREDLDRFGVDLSDRSVSPEFAELMRFEIARNRALYDSAAVGIDLLPSSSARGIRVAHALYGRILVEIERNGYDVFAERARVSVARKVFVAAQAIRSH